MTREQVREAIEAYFDAERRAMLVIIGGSVGTIAASVIPLALTRGSFARAFGVTAIVSATLLSATAVWLLRRDPSLRRAVLATAESSPAPEGLATESRRIDGVVALYRYYRYAAVAIGALALSGLLLLPRGGVTGTAAGALLLAVSQQVIDYYSEARSRRYGAALRSAVDGNRGREAHELRPE